MTRSSYSSMNRGRRPILACFLFLSLNFPAQSANTTLSTGSAPEDILAIDEGERSAEAKTLDPLVEGQHSISLERVQIKVPHAAQNLFAEAWQALSENDLDRAIRKLEKAIKICPEFAEAHNNVGYFYWKQGNVQDALEHFTAAAELDPTWGTAVVNLALALYQQRRFDEARTTIARALALHPASARAHYAAGLIFLNWRNTEALEHLRRAGDAFPKARLLAVYIMLQLNRPEQAQETLHRYLTSAPAN